ncbi:MAG: lytic transglycosylase domain-containing protein, partial [Leptospiraceae bacterium]|nr:lytic transglycosylase domain-containing protein [Leptospiraceae bacterium]
GFLIAAYLILRGKGGGSDNGGGTGTGGGGTGGVSGNCDGTPILQVPATVLSWLPLVSQISGLDSSDILAIIWQETSGVNGVRGQTCGGEIGLMQICPATAVGLGYSNPEDLWDASKNIAAGTAYFREALSAAGNLFDAYRYYNGGPATLLNPSISEGYACQVLQKSNSIINTVL